MAVALSLLIVLPGLAQSQNYDDTRGMLSSGSSLMVAVMAASGSAQGVDGVAESYFDGNLYVSNDLDAHNEVRITAVGGDPTKPHDATVDATDANGDPVTTADPNAGCVQATVRNNRSTRSIKVALPYSGNDAQADFAAGENDNQVVFQVIEAGLEGAAGKCAANATNGQPATAGDVGKIAARDGDTLTITVTGVTGSIQVTVDGEGPEFTEISPADKTHLGSQTVKFRFVVTDDGSGLAHDGELDYSRGDLDARAHNKDNDNFTTGEPRAAEAGDGASRDIEVRFSGKEESKAGTSGWRQRGGRPGVSYFLDMAITNVPEEEHGWHLMATDRAGNTARTDSDSDKSGPQDFTLTVDVSNPEFRSARTGISYDTSKGREVVDRSSIAIIFEEGDGSLDSVQNIDADKFLVDGVEVTGFVQPVAKAVCKGEDGVLKTDYPADIDGQTCGFDGAPLSRIYLQLAEPLAPDATPLISMFGGAVNDLAGNPSNQDEITAQDYIAPTITVSVSAAVTGRPVVRHNGEVTVSIASDEELRRLPTVYFVPLSSTEKDSDGDPIVKLGASRPAARVTAGSEDNSWQQTYRTNQVGSDDNIYAVVVVGEDDNDNVGSTTGYKRARTDKAPAENNVADFPDLIAAGLLAEVDTNQDTDAPGFTLTPETDTGTKKTVSANPYVTVDFSTDSKADRQGEDKEYGGSFKGDSHSAVEIVSITLNSNSVAGNVSSVSSNKYTVGLRDLSNGAYELKVTGRDDVGNETTASYKFTKAPRAPYEIDLTPGWNLISVPGTPLDSNINAVMGDAMEAGIVLAYQDEEWLTAVNDQGTWRGTLTEIVGGYGYWVQTTAFESISALIPETDTSSVLPTARVIKGWNLLGVVDVQQAAAGKAPSGNGEADDYFNNFDWRVTYAFNTANNQWTKTLPDVGDIDEIENGKGYWVWSTEDATLVP